MKKKGNQPLALGPAAISRTSRRGRHGVSRQTDTERFRFERPMSPTRVAPARTRYFGARSVAGVDPHEPGRWAARGQSLPIGFQCHPPGGRPPNGAGEIRESCCRWAAASCPLRLALRADVASHGRRGSRICKGQSTQVLPSKLPHLIIWQLICFVRTLYLFTHRTNFPAVYVRKARKGRPGRPRGGPAIAKRGRRLLPVRQ